MADDALNDVTPWVAGAMHPLVKSARDQALDLSGPAAPIAQGVRKAQILASLQRIGVQYRLPVDLIPCILRGDQLETEHYRFDVYPMPGASGYDLLSDALGEGVFIWTPLEDIESDHDTGQYRIEQLQGDGALSAAGLTVATRDLETLTAGLIVASRPLGALEFDSQVPESVQGAVEMVSRQLADYAWYSTTDIFAVRVLANLKLMTLSPDEVMQLLARLKPKGLLGPFLSLINYAPFRNYLQRQQVPWDYVFHHWDQHFRDHAQTLMGFFYGCLENVTEVFEFIGLVIGAPFDEEKAREMKQFVEAIKQLFESPIEVIRTGLRHFRKAFEDAMWELRFFEAGRLVAQAVMTLIEIPEIVIALYKVTRSLVHALVKLVDATVITAREIGVPMRDFLEFLMNPGPPLEFAYAGGAGILMRQGDDILVLVEGLDTGKRIPAQAMMSAVGEQLGSGRKLDDLSDLEIDKLVDEIEQGSTPKVTGGRSKPRIEDRAVPKSRKLGQFDIEDVPLREGETPRQAVARLRQVFGRRIDEHPRVLQAWNEARESILSRSTLNKVDAPELYERTRDAFWRRVRKDPQARAYFEEAGFEFVGADERAPRIAGVGGQTPAREITVSLDHLAEKAQGDNWRKALDADNLQYEPSAPNTDREIRQARHPELRAEAEDS